MTLLRDLIDIPEQVHKSAFVISLESAIDEPEATMRDYVVTPQLAQSFDRALSLIGSAVDSGKSMSSYLHASFGAGKSAFMAVTHLLIQGVPAARANTELAPIVAKHDQKISGRNFLLVPYQAVGAESLEQIVLGGYVEHIRAVHPEASLPAVYIADGVLEDSVKKREQLGDEVFFRLLSEGNAADEWGDYGADWTPERFESALAPSASRSERDQLISALLRTHYSALPGQAQAAAEGFVPFDDGLEAISRHAKSLGYDAVILFLDELVLWLASRMSDAAFVSREGAKVVKLVEGDAAERPAPIISFIARQRELRELVGENIMGLQAKTATDILEHSAGRFDTITLEDRNLPAIAERRLLRPIDDNAKAQLDEAFEKVRREIDERGERDVLLTDTGDVESFRKLYPFSPALVEALVALSGAMQRERTALKVMLQLLVDHRETLEVGQLVPLGDLFDAVNAGDEPLTEIMRSQFAQVRRLWSQRFEPMLLQNHGLQPDDVDTLLPNHAFVTDARLVKTLLIAALVPEVPSLRGLTVSRLTALNSGTVRAFIPGTERQQVLDKLRAWNADIGELQLGDDEQDPTVVVRLDGIDTAPILDAAKNVDSDGERRRRLKEIIAEMIDVKDLDSFDATISVQWRGFPREVEVMFANVRDSVELPDEALRAGERPKLIIDYPWDSDAYGPTDDRARIDDYRRDRSAEWTAVWLPNFLSEQSRRLLGRLVRLDYILTGDTFDQLANHLSAADRPLARSQLQNERNAVRERVNAVVRQAYGVDQPQQGTVDNQLSPGDQFNSLDPAMALRPPVGTSLRSYAEKLAEQMLAHRFPQHPDFAERISTTDLRHALAQVTAAFGEPNARLENVEPAMRKVLQKVAGPLQLGTMYQAHFIADVQIWIDLIERRRAETGAATLTVGLVRQWLNAADDPTSRRGMNTEVANLVILAVCAATDRTIIDGGRPVLAPDVARLRDDAEIRVQDLPPQDIWDAAVNRAADIGIVPASTLRTATSVADLSEKVRAKVAGDRAQAVRDLPALIRIMSSLVELDSSAPRLQTAEAAVSLLDELTRRPDDVIEVLAQLAIPTTMAAIGTSIDQAGSVGESIRSLNVDLVRMAIQHTGQFASEATSIASQLANAAAADELTIALRQVLGKVQQDATDLMGKIAAANGGAGNNNGGNTTTGGDGGGTAPPVITGDTSAAMADATAHLDDYAEQLKQVGIKLDFTLSRFDTEESGES